jgi:glycosyltransferase involved in cell wall biosynthesis
MIYRVLHIIVGLDVGGAELALKRLIGYDNRNITYQHTVISLTTVGHVGRDLFDMGIEVRSLGMNSVFQFPVIFFRLLKIIKNDPPSIVQTWMYHSDFLGGLVAKLSGINPVIWGIRGPYNRERTSFSTKLVVYSCRLLSRLIPKFIISNSYFAKNAHIDIGYSPKKFKVIPNGYSFNLVVFSEQERDTFYKKYQIDPRTLVLGMVSRFDPYKDHNNLFSALKILQSRSLNFICLLVGSGMDEENSELLSLLKKHNISSNIRLLGCSDSVPQLMSLLDLHILSSAAESFPNVLAEAMIMGTPCVTTDVGDAKIIVADTGWVVPAESSELLADAVEKASIEIKNRAVWKKRQQMCRDRIENNYSLETMISAYHDVWEEAVNG